MQNISKKAKIGSNCKIGDYVKIHDNVILGNNSTVEDHCILGKPIYEDNQSDDLIIGNNSLIRSHSIFYEGSIFEEGLETGHNVVVREKINAGQGFRIGTMSSLDGSNIFGNYVMINSFVQISKGTKIGNFVWIYPKVIITNDPLPPSFLIKPVTIGDMSIICANVVLLPGVKIGKGSFICAGSLVTKDVPPVNVFEGNPAKFRCELKTLNKLPYNAKYPWHDHFSNRYPKKAQKLLKQVGEDIRTLMERKL